MLCDDNLISYSREYITSLSDKDLLIFIRKFIKSLNEKDFSNFSKNAIIFSKGIGFTGFSREYLDSLETYYDKYKANIYSKDKIPSYRYPFKFEDILIDDKIDEHLMLTAFLNWDDITFMQKKGMTIKEAEDYINYSNYIFNPKIVDLVYDYYLENIRIYDEMEEESQDISRLKISLNFALGEDDRINIIKTEHRKYSEKLQKNQYYLDYFNDFNKKNIYNEDGKTFDNDFIKLFKRNLGQNDDLMMDYLCDGYTYNYEELAYTEFEPIQEFDIIPVNKKPDCDVFDIFNYREFRGVLHITDCFKALNFLESELKNKIDNSADNQIDNKIFHDKIFKTIDSQNIFYKTLDYTNVLNNNGKAKKRGFQPICDAIFNKPFSFFDEIFKYGVTKKDYIIYLENEFDISIPDKSKLSDGSRHTENVKDFINSCLKEQNKTKE
ncbi:hypothetical protein [Lutibacter citreus]|uniref:hypothetical protein n=1 Tax=Lutibacter citreus TaxID=2138210 RepID=UPI001C553263|nr:hypothetical protein [Lutibacter citreus]